MYIDSMDDEPMAQTTQDQEPVTTILLCKNVLAHRGLQHLLAGTRFGGANTAHGETSGWPETPPDLFLVNNDPRCPHTADVIRHVKAQCPGARVVVLAEHFEREAVLAQYAAGADGFCLASNSREVLVASLELVMLGQAVLPPEVILSLLDEVSQRPQGQALARAEMAVVETSHAVARKLSSREAEILRCLMKGEPNKVIARNLDVAEATVKVHVKAILRKIGAGNRTQAAIWATEHLPTGGRASSSL